MLTGTFTVENPTNALMDVVYERSRQISVEGYLPFHDDGHDDESLAKAAACYALPPDIYSLLEIYLWPWRGTINRKTRRRDLVRAAALLLAEIERIDRIPK